MSNDPNIQRINNALPAISEHQAEFDQKMRVMQEAIAGLIQVARLHNEQIDEIRRQTAENGRQIAELREQGKEQDERLNALIRIVEGHISNHP
ncbi:MAG TPA: hypothetical protein VJZ91_05645 [Blastocatellia bacterium]|nr:hypothetical protein [Blastocatellia bacterium]